MKKVLKNAITALAAIAVVGFVGCNKDDDGGGKGPVTGKEAVLKIKLKSGAMQGTRVPVTDPGQISDDANTEIKNFSVFVFNADGYCWKGHFDVTGSTYTGDGTKIEASAEGPVGTLAVNTTAKKVYVIANAGDQTANFTSEDDMRGGVLADLTTQYPAMDPWATWVNDTDLTFTTIDGVQTAQQDAECRFVAARITVKVDNRMTNWGASPSVAINNLVVLNARGQSQLFPAEGGTSLIPATYAATKKYYQGMSVGGFANHPATGEMSSQTILSDTYEYKASTEAEPVTSDYYYYVFESDGATAALAFPTVVTLVGTAPDLSPEAAPGATVPNHYPVHMASYETFETNPFTATTGIQRGKSYDITILLTGDASIPNGTEDPTIPLLNAEVEVTISIEDWVPVELVKEFN